MSWNISCSRPLKNDSVKFKNKYLTETFWFALGTRPGKKAKLLFLLFGLDCLVSYISTWFDWQRLTLNWSLKIEKVATYISLALVWKKTIWKATLKLDTSITLPWHIYHFWRRNIYQETVETVFDLLSRLVRSVLQKSADKLLNQYVRIYKTQEWILKIEMWAIKVWLSD